MVLFRAPVQSIVLLVPTRKSHLVTRIHMMQAFMTMVVIKRES